MAGGKRCGQTARAAVDPVNNMIINQIMLKYRPIAPRPVTAERFGCLVPLKEKRKYVRAKKKINDNINNKRMILDKTKHAEFVETDRVHKVSEFISFDVSENNIYETFTRSTPPVTVESWITMESITGSCEDVGLLRYTDEEIRKYLETNSCPCFISNGYDEVQWVNLAYKKMVDLCGEDGARPPELLVWLKVKMEILSMVEYLPPAYSCRVRVVYQCLEKKKQMTVPCDVWKMDSGGYAWRLDVKAALSL